MNLVKIEKEIKSILANMKNDDDLFESNVYTDLRDLKEEIEKQIILDQQIATPSDRKQMNAIKRYLGKSKKPIFTAFTPLENGKVGITDSYTLFVLNKETLPFNIACNSDTSNDTFNEYLKKYDIKENRVIAGTYPTFRHAIPECTPLDTFEVDTKEVLAKNKLKTDEYDSIEFKTKENQKICLSIEYLKNMIDILKIKDSKITMGYYGETRPATYENENGLGVVLPIKKY